MGKTEIASTELPRYLPEYAFTTMLPVTSGSATAGTSMGKRFLELVRKSKGNKPWLTGMQTVIKSPLPTHIDILRRGLLGSISGAAVGGLMGYGIDHIRREARKNYKGDQMRKIGHLERVLSAMRKKESADNSSSSYSSGMSVETPKMSSRSYKAPSTGHMGVFKGTGLSSSNQIKMSSFFHQGYQDIMHKLGLR